MHLTEKTLAVKRATIEKFDTLWKNNFLSNRDKILRNHCVRKFYGKFKDIPSILVGAGPSLDKNIRHLTYVKDKSLIVSCDAALKTLIYEKIVPSFVVVLDPQDFIINFFQGIDTRRMFLIVPTIVHPKVLDYWEGKIIFYNKFAPDIPLLKQIEQTVNNVGNLTPGGSVLSVGYDFLFKTGSNPIIFVGQDLSYSDNMAYAGSTIYSSITKKNLLNREKENIVFEKDMFGNTVPTLKSMSVTKTWFEWAFTTWKRDNKTDIVNCTEGGILIGKCLTMPLSEAVYKICKKTININWNIKKIIK